MSMIKIGNFPWFKMQLNTSLGAGHHHTTLRVENNQSRRRPTSWSHRNSLFSVSIGNSLRGGNTFLLDLLGTASLIAGKTREKVELLSLNFLPPPPPPPPPFFFSFSSFYPLPTVLLGLKSSLESILWPHVNTPLAHWISLITLSIYLGFLSNHVLPHVSYGSHLGSLFELPCT